MGSPTMGVTLERLCSGALSRKVFGPSRHPPCVVPSFREALAKCLEGIPRGRVATCGTVAVALGDPRAARSVATWLREHPDVPGAHRVIRADGRPVSAGAEKALAADGVTLQSGLVPADRFVASLTGVPILVALRAEQARLAASVSEEDEQVAPRTLGGVDVAYAGDRAFAVAVSLDALTLRTLEVCEREVRAEFPYIPTYLAFREFPAIAAAWQGLREKPDLLFVDGHGRLHPTLFGFACFAGVRLGVPSIGIAKHPLAGRPAPSAGRVRDAVPIEMDGVVRGYAWTPPEAARPFYVSVGHRISLRTALEAAQRATRRRYPEPLVVADRRSKEGRDKKNAERSASGTAARARSPAQERQGA